MKPITLILLVTGALVFGLLFGWILRGCSEPQPATGRSTSHYERRSVMERPDSASISFDYRPEPIRASAKANRTRLPRTTSQASPSSSDSVYCLDSVFSTSSSQRSQDTVSVCWTPALRRFDLLMKFGARSKDTVVIYQRRDSLIVIRDSTYEKVGDSFFEDATEVAAGGAVAILVYVLTQILR